MEKLQYNLSGLCCANCAAKIEKQISDLADVKTASVDFINKKLTVQTNSNVADMEKQAKKIIASIDSNIQLHAEHEEESEEEFSFWQTIISVALFIAALLLEKVFHLSFTAELCYGAAILLAGYRVLISGIKGMIHRKINENALMTIAVVAAFCLGQYAEAAIVAILFDIGEMLEDRAVGNSRKSIEHLAEIRPDNARKIEDSVEKVVAAEKISVGDVIAVHPYERIPLDGVVTTGTSALDSSALTGESLPVEVSAGSEVLSGMMNGQGLLTIQVTNDFSNSAASRIIGMVESAAARKGQAEKLITRFAEIYTPAVIGLAILLMLVPPLLGLGSFSTWLYRALIFLVASCPCALVISVPLGFYAGIGAESKCGVLIKGGKYLEVLSKADAVVFDKTGTLTNGVLSVSKVTSLGNWSNEELLQTAASIEQYSAHPAAKAVMNAANGIELLPATDIAETAGHGVSAVVNGKEVLCGRKILLESHGIPMDDMPPASIYIAVDGKPEGYIDLSDTIKPDAAACVAALKRLNIKRVVMLTGDHESAATAAAEQCGITEYHAGLLPEDKVTLMEKIREESGKAVFVGDGINDAPVLAAADCGVAMGLGTDAAIEASDVVLTLDKPIKLAEAIRLSQRAMHVIYANIVFSLGIKAIVLILAALGFAPMWLAVFADVGVSILAVMNATRILRFRSKEIPIK